MIKEIKIEREINSLLNLLKWEVAVENFRTIPHLIQYKLNDNVYIHVNISKVNNNVVIYYESFPYYNKIVHSVVLKHMRKYKNYRVKVFSVSNNEYINIDEL